MSPPRLVLAVDQGSSSTKALLVSAGGAVVAAATVPVASDYPQPGRVEQSAVEIEHGVRTAVRQCLAGTDPRELAAIGLSTQRESLVLWERATGRPLGPLISWQDQRGAALCAALLAAGHGDFVRQRSGLPLDPMFSATRATWLLDTHDPDRRRSRAGDLCLGTVDSWLLHRFTGRQLTEVGNASRTQLMNVGTGAWDPGLLEIFGVPVEVLGSIVPSVGPYPTSTALDPLPAGVPIGAVLGDSHAALFAHGGRRPGTVKATYGTGSSVMTLCPADAAVDSGLCLTVGWDDGSGPRHALEGNIRSSGATLGWLASAVRSTPAELADLAAGADSAGVHLVPAFNGLGAPHWDRDAVGMISGLTLGVGLPQIARAALESVVFQVEDVLAAIEASGTAVDVLLADGGASANVALMQLQADVSGRTVARAVDTDLSALGAAHLAGRVVGLWSADRLDELPRPRQQFRPTSDAAERRRRLAGWRDAVERARQQTGQPAPQ